MGMAMAMAPSLFKRFVRARSEDDGGHGCDAILRGESAVAGNGSWSDRGFSFSRTCQGLIGRVERNRSVRGKRRARLSCTGGWLAGGATPLVRAFNAGAIHAPSAAL